MGWFKIIDAKSGKVLQDSRVEEMSERRQNYIAQLEALAEKDDDPEFKKQVASLVEAATKSEHRLQQEADFGLNKYGGDDHE